MAAQARYEPHPDRERLTRWPAELATGVLYGVTANARALESGARVRTGVPGRIPASCPPLPRGAPHGSDRDRSR